MGSIWLRDLEQVLRSANPPCPILTVPGWENRSNASGGYEAMRGLVVHHTASGPSADGWPDVNYETFQDAEKPNAMLKVSRKGEVFIMTAGSANTQGLGGPIIGVPLNRGNFQLIGIELSNNGVGEPYPPAQQNSTLWLCRTLVARYGAQYGWNHNSVISHFEWAPTRKNDPAGPSRWSPGGGRWDMNRFRSDIATLPIPPPPGGLTLTPEDKSYLDAKFAAIWEHVFPETEGVGADTAAHRCNYSAIRIYDTILPQLADVQKQVTSITTGTIDPVVLAAAVKAALAAALADPATLAAVVKAVNDDSAQRRTGWT